MGDIVKHIQELIDEGRFIEERREKYVPLPSYEDWCEARGFNRPSVAGNDKEDGKGIAPPAEGIEKKDQSNPLRRGDESTII
jgi:hypothetical protein